MEQDKSLQGIVEPPVNTQLRWKHPSDAVSLFPQDEGLPQQEDGEMTAVEHLLSEQKNITFMGESLTGKVTIKTTQDVAFLFKNLESAASENVFAVLHKKDGTYTVLYVSTGTSTQSLIGIKQIVTAANKLNATAVTLVHNHPSGSLGASKHDYAIHARLEKAFSGMNIEVHDSVIIDTDSGQFSVFNNSDNNNIDKLNDEKETVEAKVYQFDRKKLYIPTHQLTQIATPKDVATFLSRQKRGAAGKLQVIVLDSNNHITRYFFIDENLPSETLKNKLIVETGKHGNKVILTSNGKINQSQIRALKTGLDSAMIDVLDVLVIKQNKDILNNYVNFQETGMLEQSTPYSNSPALFREFPFKIGHIKITSEQRLALREGKHIVLSGIKDRAGKVHGTTCVILDQRTNKIKLLQPQNKNKFKIIPTTKPVRKKTGLGV
jgi:DNA repair protein RadC